MFSDTEYRALAETIRVIMFTVVTYSGGGVGPGHWEYASCFWFVLIALTLEFFVPS